LVEFKNLANPADSRRVREVISVGNDLITVYEPTLEQVQEILDLQESFRLDQTEDGEDDGGTVFFTNGIFMRKIAPMLTDITGTEDMTDEEVDEVVANPSVALTQLLAVVQSILTDVYKIAILQARNKMNEQDNMFGIQAAGEDVLKKTMLRASQTPEGRDGLKQVMEHTEALNKLMEQEQAQLEKSASGVSASVAPVEEVEEGQPEVTQPITNDQASEALADAFRAQFDNTEASGKKI
jgi:hypothetical protein